MTKIRNSIQVTTTKTKSEYIGKKRIIIEAPRKNTRLIYVAISYDYNGATFEDFEPFAPNEAKFYSAPKGKRIEYIKYYTDEGTQYLNFTASDGSISRTFVHDPDFEENEWGVIDAHAFTTTDWEELKNFVLAWTDRSIRKYLKVKVKFSNAGGSAYKAEVRILEDDDDIENKAIYVPASGTKTLELYTRQPPLFNVHSTIKIQAKVSNIALAVDADTTYSRWDVDRRLSTEELMRAEYSPNLCGIATWNTPTMIPRFTAEEWRKAWNQNIIGAGETMPYVTPIGGSGTYYMQNKCVLPPLSMVVLMSNILYGHVNWMPMKWGIVPQTGADRSIGFDRPTFVDCACFQIYGTTFRAISRAFGGHQQITNLTWVADYATTMHRYEILWFPNRVEFLIDETVVAVHTVSPEFPSGLQFLNNDAIAGNMEIASHFEIENMAGEFPIAGKRVTNIITSASIAASGEAHKDLNLQRPKNIALTIKLTYHASATAGARVYLLASQDSAFTTVDSENVTDAFAYFDPSFTAGQTRQKTINVDAIPQYLRVLVRNLDGSQAITTVTVDMTIGD